jgi:ATP-dependent Clp protease adaptor protein ClpS|tara:strand:- start:98 stop:409 length:312 start_codon:yes stop_codon:yes gene_type:complete
MSINSSVEVNIDPKTLVDIRPPKFNVVFIRDDYTTQDFVVHVLECVFNHTHDRATDFAIKIKDRGKAIVGTYNYEIAETKAIETTGLARSNNFPLKVSLEQLG